jgi:hypothetical protein
MRPFRGTVVLGALVTLLLAEGTSQAAWNNVFQVSCFRRRRVTVAQYAAPCCPTPVVAAAPPCPAPCPQPVCTTQYVQRSYYQPVTTYQTRTYYEPVTTYQTSYYYEPVCSYRYSCYYDPCTCSYQQVATPVTSYRLRSRCNAVTSYLQRCQQVPVTSYRLSTYYEPVTTCCTPTVAPCCNGSAPAVGAVPAPGAPAIPALPTPPAGGQPGVGEQQTPQQPAPSQKPAVGEYQEPPRAGGRGLSRERETPPPPMPGAGSSFRQPPLRAPAVPSVPPRVRFDRIAEVPPASLKGQVVQAASRQPQAGARLLFVSVDVDGRQQSVTADRQGRFQTNLGSGNWLVYVRNREGIPVYQARIDLTAQQTRQMTLVSR